MTSAMRKVLARQSFEQKLLQVTQLVATAKALKAARSRPRVNYVKERDALFAGDTLDSLFEEAVASQTKQGAAASIPAPASTWSGKKALS